MNSSVQGVFAAVLTPLSGDLAPDRAAIARHCRWLRDNGCDGLSVLGTTGEANSFSVEERERLLEDLKRAVAYFESQTGHKAKKAGSHFHH